MLIPPLSRRSDAFLERNLFLQAALGIRVYGGRFSAYVESVVRGIEPGPRRAKRGSGAAAPNFERDVLLVLGLLGLWRRCEEQLMLWSDAGERAAVASTVAREERGTRDFRGLFR